MKASITFHVQFPNEGNTAGALARNSLYTEPSSPLYRLSYPSLVNVAPLVVYRPNGNKFCT